MSDVIDLDHARWDKFLKNAAGLVKNPDGSWGSPLSAGYATVEEEVIEMRTFLDSEKWEEPWPPYDDVWVTIGTGIVPPKAR